jgi:putative MATE family efflux protein
LSPEVSDLPEALDKRDAQAPAGMPALRRQVFSLAWPAVLEMLLHMSVWVVDTALVARLGSTPLAAVALGGQVFYMIAFVFASVGVGATALVARYVGAGQDERARAASGQAVLLALALGAAGFVAVRAVLPLVLRLAGVTPEVFTASLLYGRTVSYGIPLMVFNLTASGVLRGHGNTRTPLYITATSNAVSVVAEYVFIFGWGPVPRLELYGAALAPVLGMLLGFVLSAWVLFRSGAQATVAFRDLARPDRGDLVRLLRLSLPAGLEMLLMDGARTVNMALIGVLGSSALAAYQIVATSESLSFMPGYGFAIAASIVTGQSLGARDPHRARQGALAAWQIGAGLMATLGLTFILFPRFYIGLFTAEPAVVSTGAAALRIAGFSQFFVGTTEVFTGALRGAGDTRSAMLITLVGAWAIRVPVTFLVVRRLGLGLSAAWAVMLADWALRAALAWMRFRSGKWQRIRL